MKYFLYIPLLFLIGITFSACDTTTDPNPFDETGSIFVQTTDNFGPVTGVEIWVDGVNSGATTPDSVTGLSVGNHTVTLVNDQYRDTTITLNVREDLQTSISVQLVSSVFTVKYGPIKIWETNGTGANQPSGIDLSTGTAYAISGSDNDKVDIYYSTSGTGGDPYLVQSADLATNLTRETRFRVGSGTNLDDGGNSPDVTSGTWVNWMDDREPNYVFLYDDDNHYSKIIIASFGGGVQGDPDAWVTLTWYYNQAVDDTRF